MIEIGSRPLRAYRSTVVAVVSGSQTPQLHYMLREYGECAGLNMMNQPVKRNYEQQEPEYLRQPCSKRLKGEISSGWWLSQENQAIEKQAEEAGFLTPASTPADGSLAASQQRESSPYSEAEDYMVQGYYQDELLVHERRPCVESLQYNLYDITPEEFELIEDEQENEAYDRSGTNGAYASWQSATNDTAYDESYDIDM